MPDIADGESVEIQGSAAKPYVLTNTGGVYSCTCPAWRNQSIGIERRTCKHLRKYRGDQAEEDRLGGELPAKALKSAEDVQGPPVLLAHAWDFQVDLTGWWFSEKLDGVRAYWDGKKFLSRQGNEFMAPAWFVDGLPSTPLDGELWLDRKAFQKTISIVRRQDRSEHWKQIRYVVFDSPAHNAPFEERIATLKSQFKQRHTYVQLLEHSICESTEHLKAELARVESLGGEGLMVRQPGSRYEIGRSSTLLKIKTFHDAEATVVAIQDGKGKHKGRMGALVVELPDGTQFSVGTGFSDRERERPPEIGALVTFRYQELTDGGVPRFPSFVRRAVDKEPDKARVKAANVLAKTDNKTLAKRVVKQTAGGKSTAESETKASKTKASTTASARYFECTDGNSSKFWEISWGACEVTTRWGRIGTDGQSKTKSFDSAQKVDAERDKLILEKTSKGYNEVS
jgi:DNA ligase 1